MKTMQQAYREASESLQVAGIAEASLDAWLLLEHVTSISKAMYYAQPNRELSANQEEAYQALVAKRASRIPLQHLTGEQEFMGLSFRVNEHVLIPRQDTEVLVEEAILRLEKKLQSGEQVEGILDVCTGSGCILLSILSHIQKRCGIQLAGDGVDLSKDALAVARENAKQLGIDAHFWESDLFANVTKRYACIVSNPPYIPTDVIATLEEEVRVHEPWMALDGACDGLLFYRKIVSQAKDHLLPQGLLLLEIGHDQGEAVSNLLSQEGYREIIVKKDLAGLDRLLVAVYDGEKKEN
jgi:release factor glutamine methyltransferase